MNKEYFYNGNPIKSKFVAQYFGISEELDFKLNEYQRDLDMGFSLHSTMVLKKFIQGHEDISDFQEQFVKLKKFFDSNNPYAACEDRMILTWGETLGKEKWREYCVRFTGENNPQYNHGGRLSPWSKKSEVHTEEQRQQQIQKIKETKKDPQRRSNTTIEYWLSRGYKLEEQKKLLAERQCTFSLEKCIEKYGEGVGYDIWKTRQEKWQATLNSKSEHEKESIRMRKSSGIGAFANKNKKCKLYYLKFKHDKLNFWKIGITTKDVFNGRLPSKDVLDKKFNIQQDEILILEYDTVTDAYSIEQAILGRQNNKRITVDIPGFKSTECFSEDIGYILNETVKNNASKVY